MLKSIQSNNSPGHSHNGQTPMVDLSVDSCPGILLKRNNKMKLNNINDLPDGKALFLGNHPDFCNRYLRKGNVVEVQNIYRYAKPGETNIMTAECFKIFCRRGYNQDSPKRDKE